MSGYRPEDYWSRRLEREFNLRGTGQQDYDEAYNAWLYRAKRRALGRALRRAGDPSSALDVGSGVGWVVKELRRRDIRVEGCDIALVAVERLRELFPDSTFFRVSVGEEPIPRPDATFDLVTALDVTYHMTDEEIWRTAVMEMGRVLRTGGCLIVIDALGDQDLAVADHVRFRSLGTWSSAAASAGLEVEAVLPCYRWLSRGRSASRLSRLDDGTRGAVEYALEWLVPRAPHMRCAVLRRHRP